ncbi:helix-turn-helix domain-containing protein [Rhodococcus hoagii]|nr:helix-turn-helix domain-containing protein [Prescottella equi]
MDELSSKIAASVRAVVKEEGISQADLASIIGRSVSTAERRLAGKREFTVNEAILMAKRTGRKIDDIVAKGIL